MNRFFKVKLSEMQFIEGEMWGFPSNSRKWGCSDSLVKMNGLIPSGVSTIIYFGSEDCSVEEKMIPKLGGKIHKPKMSIGSVWFHYTSG